MSSLHQNKTLDRALRAWLDGSIGRAMFVSLVFENLTPDNLHIFLRLVSRDDLEILKSAAANAPTTELGWQNAVVAQNSFAPDAERKQGEDKESIRRYRRGVETLRQSLE